MRLYVHISLPIILLITLLAAVLERSLLRLGEYSTKYPIQHSSHPDADTRASHQHQLNPRPLTNPSLNP